jgi:hypothetical protein
VFEHAAEALQSVLSSAGATAAWDGQVRQLYQSAIRSAVDALRQQALSGQMSWRHAAEQAQQLRNGVMDTLRGRSSPTGLAIAQWMKAEGLTLNELAARYTVRLFGAQAQFPQLTVAQQQRVYAEIVDAAGRSRPVADALGNAMRIGGRVLFVTSLAVSIYAVATSASPGQTAVREGAVLGAGLAGSIAGGAAAGLMCGPGAPVCVTMGAFVGGAMFGLGVSFAWN